MAGSVGLASVGAPSLLVEAARPRRAMSDDYRDSLGYLFSRLDYEQVGMPRSAADLGVGRIRRLLKGLGDPQDALRIVHVAGTKGKGSTSAMIASAAQAAGLKVGLFTSPHLHRLEERYRVDGREVTAGELVGLVEAVRPAVDRLDRDDPHVREGGGLTFFEITTAMGLVHFARLGAGLVILEVGMGGRLDSTNAVRPLVSVVTTISLDHTRLLGSTLGAIAAEKAGILKRGRPAVSGVRGEEARGVIARIAGARRSPLRAIDDDFTYQYEPPEAPVLRPGAGRVRVVTGDRDWGWVDLPLHGDHQALNASVALATLDVLAGQGIEVGPGAVGAGFASLSWPARTEVLGDHPWVVVDGAHNPSSSVALAEALRACFPAGPRTLVFGTTREKDFRGQLEALVPDSARIVVTRYRNNPRAVPPDDLADAVVSLGHPRPLVVDDPASAWELARSITPPDGLICITGSLFLAAEMRTVILGLAADPARERA